jgi:hypothetical protein
MELVDRKRNGLLQGHDDAMISNEIVYENTAFREFILLFIVSKSSSKCLIWLRKKSVTLHFNKILIINHSIIIILFYTFIN